MNNKKVLVEIIKKIQVILVEDVGIPLDSAKKINNLLKIMLQVLDKE